MCNFVAPNSRDLTRHCLTKHRLEKCFYGKCAYCCYSSLSWNALKIHLRRGHGEYLDTTCVQLMHGVPNNNEDSGEDFDNTLVLSDTKSIQRDDFLLGKYLLSLESAHRVTKNGINDIVATTEHFVGNVLEKYSREVLSNLPNEIRETVKAEMDKANTTFNSFAFDTNRKRLKFYEEFCHFIKPKEVLLGEHYVCKRGQRKMVLKKEVGYNIPFKKTLELLLNQREYYHYYTNNHYSADEFMRDICDGDVVKEHKFNAENKSFLQLILSFDDLEIQNPLRANKCHHISMFYFQIANIPCEYRSKLKSIFLLATAKSKNLSQFGFQNLLKDFIETVNSLRTTGVPMWIAGKQVQIFGDLLFFIGDGLGSCQIGQFKLPGFSWKPCWKCNVSSHTIRDHFNANKFTARTTISYNEQCSNLEDPALGSTERNQRKMMYGLNGRSCLSKIIDFDVNQQILMDITHVLLEGLVPNVLALFLIQTCIEDKLYNLHWLNNKLLSFEYSYLEPNSRPEPIDRKYLLHNQLVKQKATGSLQIVLVLPLILGGVLNTCNKYYNNLLKLFKITLLCFSPIVDQTTAGELEILIEDFANELLHIYPNITPKPKLHWLTHFPEQMLKYGPLRFSSTLRFESKHSFFKLKKHVNFKNIPFSMAERHALYLSDIITDVNGRICSNFVDEGEIIEEAKNFNSNEWSESDKACISQCCPNLDSIQLVKTLSIKGHVYKKNVAVILHSNDLGDIEFGIIREILIYNDEYKIFMVYKCETLRFRNEYNAFEIKKLNSIKLLNHAHLLNKWPIPVYTIDDKLMIVNRHSHFANI